MLFPKDILTGISQGRITLAFRRWEKPTVRAGGTLLTPVGQLAIEAIDPIATEQITRAEAVAAGFSDVESVRKQLSKRTTGSFYRIRFRLIGPDPRIALRLEIPDEKQCAELAARLDRWDQAGRSGAWTQNYLLLIDQNPGVRAGDLAAELGLEKDRFKPNVRKLKSLGLTESLKVGYRLSPRGKALLIHRSSQK